MSTSASSGSTKISTPSANAGVEGCPADLPLQNVCPTRFLKQYKRIPIIKNMHPIGTPIPIPILVFGGKPPPGGSDDSLDLVGVSGIEVSDVELVSSLPVSKLQQPKMNKIQILYLPHLAVDEDGLRHKKQYMHPQHSAPKLLSHGRYSRLSQR